jgi:hypothetical protein
LSDQFECLSERFQNTNSDFSASVSHYSIAQLADFAVPEGSLDLPESSIAVGYYPK